MELGKPHACVHLKLNEAKKAYSKEVKRDQANSIYPTVYQK